jgi:hypothetical protein
MFIHTMDKNLHRLSKISKFLAIFSFLAFTLLFLGFKLNWFKTLEYSLTRNTQFSKRSEIAFPEIDHSNLSPNQIKLINILKTEYKLKPKSFDANMMKYSENNQESWCADFVSWAYREAGLKLSNPNSGSWRIPGTQTLKQYFKNQGNWQTYESGYQPKTGDVIIYKSATSPFGRHTNIVLKNENGTITTIGGNEGRTVRIQQFKLSDEMGIDGYGELKF